MKGTGPVNCYICASRCRSPPARTAPEPVSPAALVHKLAKGIMQASVATVPRRPDMRQLRFEQHTRINNKALAEELQDFTNDGYSLALYMWKRQDQGLTKDKATLRDTEWIGSRTFPSHYYGSLQSTTPRAEFPLARKP